jgi:(p)ppGpp synthase/HD superfamily hydrolase
MVNLAKIYALHKHSEQKYGNKPYSYHLNQVVCCSKKINSSDSVLIVAWLHDIVEDTDVTLDDLFYLGFNKGIVNSVYCITKQKGESRSEYIKRVKSNKFATIVKCSDTFCNYWNCKKDGGTKRAKYYYKTYLELKELCYTA